MDILGLRYVVAIDTDIMIVDHGVRTFISLYFSYSPMVSRDLRKLATISLINVRYDNSNVFWQRPALARCTVVIRQLRPEFKFSAILDWLDLWWRVFKVSWNHRAVWKIQWYKGSYPMISNHNIKIYCYYRNPKISLWSYSYYVWVVFLQ